MDIAFKDAVSKEWWSAERIHRDNDFLALSYREGHWWIYSTLSGMPYLRVPFKHKADALALGQALHRWYGEYMFIWTEWGHTVDLPALVQYTIPNGQAIYAAIERLKEQEIVYDLDIFHGLI